MRLELADGVFVLQDSVQGKPISQSLRAKTREEAEVEADGILTRWRDRLRNLYLRQGVWYCTAKVDGRRISKSLDLQEPDWEVASRRARGLMEKATKGKWEVLEATSSKPGWATFGDVVRVFQAQAVKHNLRPRTVSDYVACLRDILDANGSFESTPTKAATKAAIQTYVTRKVAGAADPEDQSVRRSIKSTCRQARALFGKKWAMESYRDAGLKLPDLSEFCTCFVCEAELKQYVMTDERKRLLGLTAAAAGELQQTATNLWTVYLLCYWLAMRSSEAQAARWSWMVQDETGRWWMQIINRQEEGFRTKGRPGKVPIPTQVKTWLDAVRQSRPGEEHILPGKSKTDRKLLVKDAFSAWMRGLGWSAETYQHCAHELRAARGSEWYTKRGLEAACQWLRHKDPATTARYYTDFTCQPPTLEVGE